MTKSPVMSALTFQPRCRAPLLIGRRRLLGDDALETELCRLLVKRRAVAPDMVAELDRRSARDGACEKSRQQIFSLRERSILQIPAVQIKQIEGIEDELAAGALGQSLLKSGDAADALVVEHDDLAVDHRLLAGQRCESATQIAVALRPVEAAPGDETRLTAIDEGDRPVTIELDLVQPSVAFGRRFGPRGELRGNAFRHRGPRRPGQAPRRQLRRLCRRLWRSTRSSMRRPVFTLSGRVRENVGGGARGGIALLEQQPVLGLLARLRLESGQHPAAVQLLAGEPELQGAGGEALVDVVHRRPDAGIPDDHRPAAIFALRDHAFEVDIFERMIFGLDRQPLVVGIERGAFRHRPALEHITDLQP